MIYITGDTHGGFQRFTTDHFPQQKQMGRDDYAIITGDFGGVWDDSPKEAYWLDWLEEKPFTSSEEIPLCSVPACGEDFTCSIPSSSPHRKRFAGLRRGPQGRPLIAAKLSAAGLPRKRGARERAQFSPSPAGRKRS